MRNLTIPLLNRAFVEVVGTKPTKITDAQGNPPSKENNYLFTEALGDFNGIAYFSNYKYSFRCYPVEKSWSLELNKI